MRAFPAAVLIALIAGLTGGTALAKDDAAAPAKPVTAKERDAAIAKGIEYLDRTVFKLHDAAGTPRKQFTVAVTGLVGLLAEDAKSKTARRKNTLLGKARKFLDAYVAEVKKRTSDPKQLPETADRVNSGEIMQYTWPMGMAGLFYGELHARGRNKAGAAKTLRTIVDILEAAQAPNGGWGHAQYRKRGKPRGTSERDGFGGYPDTLLASSNLIASSLALVKPIAAPKAENVFDRALAYYEYAELANGSFPYDPSQRSAHMDMTGVSRAAGAALAMHLLGADWEDVGMSRALELVDEHYTYLSEGHGSSTFNLMLAAFLERLRGPRSWARFKETYFRRILDNQAKNGSFTCVCENKAFGSTNDSRPFGGKARSGGGAYFANRTDTYVSAIHTLILLLDRTWPKLMPKPPEKSTAETPTTPR